MDKLESKFISLNFIIILFIFCSNIFASNLEQDNNSSDLDLKNFSEFTTLGHNHIINAANYFAYSCEFDNFDACYKMAETSLFMSEFEDYIDLKDTALSLFDSLCGLGHERSCIRLKELK